MQLKLLSPTDCQALLDFETQNKAYFEQYAPAREPEFYTFSGLYKILEKLEQEQQATGPFPYLIYENDQVIGRISLFNVKNNVAEFGYKIAEHKNGKGIATAMAAEVIELAKIHHNLAGLTAYTTTTNLSSIRVLEKNNFKHTHIVKNAENLNGKTLDFTHYKLNLKATNAP